MTTCVAAITEQKYIVAASDTRISFGGSYSAEGTKKVKTFHRQWTAMMAGSDIAKADLVVDRAKVLLRGKSGSLPTVRDSLKKAYQQEFREWVTDEWLSRFDMTMEEFKKRGKDCLNPELFASTSFLIKNADLGCTFLIYGFDDNKRPHIFTVDNPGVVSTFDRPGFWAIGSGSFSALSMLAALRQSLATGFEETVYNVLAAKYLSESASDVGRETYWFVKKYGCNAVSTVANLEESIRAVWDSEGKPKTSQGAVRLVKEAEFEFTTPREYRKLQPKMVPKQAHNL